ncbi:MAG: OmpH family outer membrane protein [Pontiellaceae bacterium]|nr:OmpH family outer membrane protein [Pontiellaceae bacterium]
MNQVFKWVLLGAVFIAGHAAAQDQVVFVDAQEVFKQYYKYEAMQDQVRQQQEDFELEQSELRLELEELDAEVQTLRVEARDETQTEEFRTNKRELLEDKLVAKTALDKEIKEFQQLRLEQIQQQIARMTKSIYDEISAAVIDYARANNYGAVVDSSSVSRNGFSNVLYVSPKIDITAEMIQVLNKGRGSE